tara:strand:- start:6779 stop:7147 length:369 start_codon:yes stop_codon:yes gene_type:complete
MKSVQNQVKTINVDEIWMTGEKDPCSKYVIYSKVSKMYINPIINDIKNISKQLRGKRMFNSSSYLNAMKIQTLMDTIDKSFSVKELQELLDNKMSLTQFIYKAFEIKRRNIVKNNDKKSNIK